jgi:hypothetical protein
MQVALIPPINQLAWTRVRPLQMILPSSLKNVHYRNRYNPNTRLSGQFVILDNGMFESGMMSNEDLIELADKWQVDELVMPDVRGNMEATLAAVDRFLNMFEQVKLDKEPSLMVVVQISHREQIAEFIEVAMNLFFLVHKLPNNLTFGIPRRLAEELGNTIRVEIASAIVQRTNNVPVHLLGYARTGDLPTIFNEVALLSNTARSIDTDAPFVWAYNESRMELDPTPFERPLGYEGLTGINENYIWMNIKTLDGWARGR